MDLGLEGRTYVVTGGTAGLGFATARCLVDEGARVVVSSRSATHVEEAVTALGAERVRGVVADNASPDAPDLLQAAWEGFGGIDGALISVGGPPAASVLETTDDVWREGFESVFLGAVRIARHVATHLTAGGQHRLRPLFVGESADRRAERVQRAAPGVGDGGQDDGRRAGSERDPGQRSDARPVRHRAGRLLGRSERGPGRCRARSTRRGCRCGGTASRRSSAASRPSCCRPPRHSSAVLRSPSTAGSCGPLSGPSDARPRRGRRTRRSPAPRRTTTASSR